MSTKVRIDGRVIEEARKAQKLSRQKLCNLGHDRKTPIGRASIERMEAAKSDQLFAYDKVKIVADLLDIEVGHIIQVEAKTSNSSDKLATTAINSGNQLSTILSRTEKLIITSHVEPEDVTLQQFIIEIAKEWDLESKSTVTKIESIEQLQASFKKKNQLKNLSDNCIYVYHANSYRVAFFDIVGREIYGEDEEAIEFIPEGAAFSSISYQEKQARDNLSTYGHDFDGIGAQRIDYLIFSDSQVAPWVNHQTNPFGFPEGTLQSISEDYERHREKES